MSILALRYHRAKAGPAGNSPEMLDAHFEHIAKSYSCILPGERADPARLKVCLTFDDAYFDFHAIVFPLLKKHRLRALLSVAPAVIRSENETTTTDVRLSSTPDIRYNHPNQGGFCTWPELREMAHSDHVVIAAHSFSHCRLDVPTADLDSEIVEPQHLLESNLDQTVTSFVFPYGRFSRTALEKARASYRHIFTIGEADNPHWNNKVIYRVNGDRLSTPAAPFTPVRRARYRARYFWNRLLRH